MSALSRTAKRAGAEAGPSAARRGLLHGTTWLVWRRHRGTFLIGFAVTALACALFAYQRIGLMDFLRAHPHTMGLSSHDDGELLMKFQDRFNSLFNQDITILKGVPIVLGMFVGVPLIASEQEQGTIRLATTQSVSRGRWIAAKLGVPLLVAFVCTSLMSAVFTWLWHPARELAMMGDWFSSGVLEATGPVPVARSLFLTVVGIAVGMLLRHVVASMAAVFVFGFVFGVFWSEKVWPMLAPLRRKLYPYDQGDPLLPGGAVRMDDWKATADGKVYGIGTCSDGTGEACRAKLGIVNRATDYYGYDQMAGMQWLGAGILVALAAAVTVFVVWWARRRPL
ncbi:ABC transporter permease subunit [Streptomyces sp. NPDC059788]|uniref:ABC transporter permease subunit n=1 Tax=Streptomyces sp. NPDC059788 TaxID=3346948 RepID=UPI00365D885E